jgi:hypothetical protein
MKLDLGLTSELCQTVGMNSFFTWHTFLEVGKTQDLPRKIWQTLRDALSRTCVAIVMN